MREKIPRPSSTACTRVAKLSSVRIIFAACLETSDPLPIATPMSACLRAAASLTASPVIATMSPRPCMSWTRRSLSWGETRPNTCSSGSCAASWSSAVAAKSVPDMPPGPRSSSAAIAWAVTRWSPVIIRTSMPARWATRTASIASGRSGSMMPTSPRNTRLSTAAIGSASEAPARRRSGKRADRQGEHAQARASPSRAFASSMARADLGQVDGAAVGRQVPGCSAPGRRRARP